MKKLINICVVMMGCLVLFSSCDELLVSKNIKWTSFEDVQANKGKKMVMVELYTPWCGWCKRMERNTFTDPNIAKYVNKNFYSIKFDAESRNPINFEGKEYNFDPKATTRGRHELASMLMKGNTKQGYPTIAFMDEDFNVIQAVPGYKNAQEFEIIIHFFAEKHYKDTDWNDFEKQFKAEKSMSPS